MFNLRNRNTPPPLLVAGFLGTRNTYFDKRQGQTKKKGAIYEKTLKKAYNILNH